MLRQPGGDRLRRRGARFPKEVDVTDVMVRLAPEAAAAVRSEQPAPASLLEAQEQLRSLGLVLEPLYAGAEDQLLAAWFRVVVENELTAEEVAGVLRASPAVESAYVEPPSAPPG